MKTEPVPGAEDLYPHVCRINDPGNPLHGEPVMSPRVLGLLIAPSVEEFNDWWPDNREAVSASLTASEPPAFPDRWQAWARGRSNELQARYNSTDVLDILRGLHREHGVFPQDVLI